MPRLKTETLLLFDDYMEHHPEHRENFDGGVAYDMLPSIETYFKCNIEIWDEIFKDDNTCE